VGAVVATVEDAVVGGLVDGAVVGVAPPGLRRIIQIPAITATATTAMRRYTPSRLRP
jgi:hypothetical protein